MNRDVEWNPLAVFETLELGQFPTISRILCWPFDIVRLEDFSQIPVKVVGTNISYAVLEDIEVSIGLSHGDPSTSTNQREQQFTQVFFLHVCIIIFYSINFIPPTRDLCATDSHVIVDIPT